jgi:RNA recognition motif-containing protein
MISYFDIRHAKAAMRNLQGKQLRRRKLDIHYSIPKDNPSEKDQNQGTLVVFNLDPSITSEELREIFGAYGEIKEIRETPNKKHHKFIEFYDVREAEYAMKQLNKTEIKSKKIKIEPSRPGGRKSNASGSPSLSPRGRDDTMVPSPYDNSPVLGFDSYMSKSAPSQDEFDAFSAMQGIKSPNRALQSRPPPIFQRNSSTKGIPDSPTHSSMEDPYRSPVHRAPMR